MRHGLLKNRIREFVKTRLAPPGSTARAWAQRLKRRLQRHFPEWFGCGDLSWPRPAEQPFDPYGSTALTSLVRLDLSDALPDADVPSAVRFLLHVLHTRPDVRRRWPRTLTDGVDGGFGRWLLSDGGREYGLDAVGLDDVRAAFERSPGDYVRRAYGVRPELRQAFPLGLTPAGCHAFARWVLRHGLVDHEVTREDVAWFLTECAEDPAGTLATTYLLTPEWQERFPHGLTAFGFRPLATWVKERYRVPGSWLDELSAPARHEPADELRLLRRALPRLAAVRDPRDVRRLVELAREQGAVVEVPGDDWWQRLTEAAPGVNVLGFFRYPSGLQEAARTTVEALTRVGLRTSLRDVPASPRDDPRRAAYLGEELFDVSLLHIAPEPRVDVTYPLTGLAVRRDVRRVAVWYWELEAVPPEWARHTAGLHEIWAPTRFIADAMRRVMPLPVVHMPAGVELRPFTPLPRSHFGLPEDRVLYLFAFDMHSVMERKNPLGLIEAYRRAFRPDDRAALVIKVTRGENVPADWARLQRAADEAGVILLNRSLSRTESYALMDCCDAYVSLHRSEGFGLTMAEAMLLGKPTVGTAYSGNLDFMTSEDSLLVDYHKTPITADLPFYPRGSLWAEPSVEHAAERLRWIYDHPEEAKALAECGQTAARARLSLDLAGRRMAARLADLGVGCRPDAVAA